jgi:hypothetical protein
MSSLDLFSTSQTNRRSKKSPQGKNDKHIYDACANNAPCFAYEITKKTYGVVQGCCNDWNCPRCGQQRAREEYGRIVEGARKISKTHQLYFLTITCRGKEVDYATAERDYLKWTNNLLTRLRVATKRASGEWCYAAVTERQKRQHPHSHFITTYCPPDAVVVKKGEGKYYHTAALWFPAKHTTLESKSLERACVECGLGFQYDISRVESVEAGSRYMAKYLFKDSIFSTIWPKNWRRVRYSQNWPKLADKAGTAFILLSAGDWIRLGNAALIVRTQNDGVKEIVRSNLYRADVIIQ